jgi:hypothetical protein
MSDYPEYISSPTERIFEMIGTILFLTVFFIADLVSNALNKTGDHQHGRQPIPPAEPSP